jgi:uncharacterized cupin superfamily protein
MKKVNLSDIAEDLWASPKGRFGGGYKVVSEALGRKPDSTMLDERHPFDVEISRIPPGKLNYPYHAHSAQWEFYQVLSGSGIVRHQHGETPVVPGDAFVFGPLEPHQIRNDSTEDLVLLVVADNPLGEFGYYPDSKKWIVRYPQRTLIRSENLDYLDGEE